MAKHIPTVTVANQKGGVGKSFIADEIAWALERAHVPFAFFDVDCQGGTCHATSSREEQAAAAVNVADMPGALIDELADVLEQTDVVVVPMRPNERDVPPTERMMRLVERDCPKATRVLVVNGWTRYLAAAAFEAHVDAWRADGWLVAYVPQSEAVARAGAAGKSVVEFARGTKVADAVRDVCELVLGQVIGHES